jgi:hypothetical protein
MHFAHYILLERGFLNPLLILPPMLDSWRVALNYMCKKESRIKSHPVGVGGFSICQKAAALIQGTSCCWDARLYIFHSGLLFIILVTLSYIVKICASTVCGFVCPIKFYDKHECL